MTHGRDSSIPDALPVADGRIYPGRQAKELKLVDELGTRQDAVIFVASGLGLLAS